MNGGENYFYRSRTVINHRGDPALVVRGREIIAPAREVILKIHRNVPRRCLTNATGATIIRCEDAVGSNKEKNSFRFHINTYVQRKKESFMMQQKI